MDSDFVQRKYLVVILASVVVGLVAFVGACALVYETGWLSSDDDVGYPVGSPPLLPPIWSPDGTKIVLDWWSGSYLVEARYDGVELTRIYVENEWERIYPHISPDGSRIAFSTGRNSFDVYDSDIRLTDLDGGNYRYLTRSRGNQFGQRWAPDGSRIAFISCLRVRKDAVERTCSLYSIAANGSGPRKLVDSVQATGGIAWSPDGRTIAFFGHERDQLGEWPKDHFIYIVDGDGSNLARLAEASSLPTWSPDGSSIAFLQGDTRDALFVVEPDGTGLRKIAVLDSIPERSWFPRTYLSWSPNGSEILLQDYPFILVKADGTEYPEGKAPYAVFVDSEDWEHAYASWAPDGSRIAITVQQAGGNDPDDREAFLLTMARDGSDKRAMVRIDERVYAVPNEPWEGEGEWVWYSP